jgi:hypothetical protein
MKPRTLLILLGLSLAFFAFIYFFERELPSTAEREVQSKQVLPIGADDVDALEVAWGGQTMRIEKEKPAKAAGEGGAEPAAVWKLVSPLQARADAGVVSNLVRRLAELQKQRSFDEWDAAETGLASPRATAKLRAKGQEYSLAFGADLPLGGAIFVGDGKKAHQVTGAADLVKELQKNPGDWRDKTLFHGERSTAEKIVLTGASRKIVLQRQGEGENFNLEEPVKDAADRDLVSGLLSDLTGLQAATFLEPGAAFTPSGRSVEVALTSAPEPFRVELGQDLGDGKVAAKVEGQLVSLDASRLSPAFEREVNGWRSLAWSGLQVFQVDRALFKTPANTTEVKRIDGEWKRGEDKIDYAIASDALYPVVEVKAQEIVSRADALARGFVLANPRLEIELDAENKKEKLAVYAANGNLAAATAEGRDSVLLLPNDKVAELESKIETLRNAKPGEAAPAALPPLEEEHEEGGAEE